jgi:hypothetical protein
VRSLGFLLTTTLAVAADGNPKLAQRGISSSFAVLDTVLRNALPEFSGVKWFADAILPV